MVKKSLILFSKLWANNTHTVLVNKIINRNKKPNN